MTGPDRRPQAQDTKTNEAWYLYVFFTLTVIGATLVLLKEVWEVTGDSWVSTLTNMGTGMAWVVIVAGALAYTGTEAFNMLSDRFRTRLRKEARQEGRLEVISLVEERIDRTSPEGRKIDGDRLLDDIRRLADDQSEK